jgi:hypothetical protein
MSQKFCLYSAIRSCIQPTLKRTSGVQQRTSAYVSVHHGHIRSTSRYITNTSGYISDHQKFLRKLFYIRYLAIDCTDYTGGKSVKLKIRNPNSSTQEFKNGRGRRTIQFLKSTLSRQHRPTAISKKPRGRPRVAPTRDSDAHATLKKRGLPIWRECARSVRKKA